MEDVLQRTHRVPVCWATPIALGLLACGGPEPPGSWVDRVYPGEEAARDRLSDSLATLVVERQGRLPGSSEDAEVQRMLASEFERLGLAPTRGDAFTHPFEDSEGRTTSNLIARIEGTDEAVQDQVVLLTAHHDHLGPGFPGANDNASGVASLLLLADRLQRDPPRRPVLVAALGAEEVGFDGAQALAGSELGDSVAFVVNLDMVGTLAQSGFVRALGARDGRPQEAWVKDAAADWPGRMVRPAWWSRRSDHEPFCIRGVPYVFFWTPDKACYHEACDTLDRIDADGHLAVSLLAEDVLRAAADTDLDLAALRMDDEDVCRKLPKAD